MKISFKLIKRFKYSEIASTQILWATMAAFAKKMQFGLSLSTVKEEAH